MTDTPIAFRPEDFLHDEASIAEYLSLALHDEDSGRLLTAMNTVARARGMPSIADIIGTESQRPGAQLDFATVQHVLQALGLKLMAVTSVSRGTRHNGPKSQRLHQRPLAYFRMADCLCDLVHIPPCLQRQALIP